MPLIRLLLPLLLLLSACSTTPPQQQETTQKAPVNRNDGRYSMEKDRAPDNPPDLSGVEDAKPKYEPYSRRGNKDYEVLGKNYSVLPTGKGFVQEGMASWYASKFHGHYTSSGEVYDMYSMSAAHKTLPLPSYVRVTNLNNKKSVIVRVNDRGPFHSTRVMDVSYAAAYKLGMVGHGTAPVRLEVIYNDSPESQALAALSDGKANYYVQVVAASSRDNVAKLAGTLEKKFKLKSRITSSADNLFRLQLGPMGNEDLATKMLDTVHSNGYPQAYLVRDATAKGG